MVENIGGAGGMIAADKAARANPDGYTILIHQVALAAGMALYQNLNFDAEKNFVTIGLINTAASTVAGRPSLPANNFTELLRWMKEPGQSIKIGHAGVGSYAHLAGVLIAQELGVAVTQVPYRGAGPALVDHGRRKSICAIGTSAPIRCQSRQAQAYAESAASALPACRTCRPWASSATRSSTSISGTCCWRPRARRVRLSTSLS